MSHQYGTGQRMRCAILFSGRGSNLNAIAAAEKTGHLDIDIVAAITDRPTSPGIHHALEYALPVWIIDPKQYTEPGHFEQRLASAIDGSEADLIVMAGFMRILSDAFVQRYAGRMINLHPSLLPKYRGLNTHTRVLENSDTIHGASVHIVTPELDAGPVIAQYQMPVLAADTAASLAERLAPHEHRLLLAVIALFSTDSVSVSGNDIKVKQNTLTKPLLLDQDINWRYSE